MARSGITNINFGGYPGSSVASIFVTSTSVGVASLLDVWICPSSGTSDHSADEHIIEKIRVNAGNIIDGSGFTITAYGYNDRPLGNDRCSLYGSWNIAWAFN